MTPEEQDRVATAYHEAGHAVVALAVGRPVAKVSIRPDADRLGWCQFGKGRFKPTEDWVENELLIALAGMAAEARQTGTYDRVAAGQDLRHARKLSVNRANERQMARLEKRMLHKCEHILGDDACWAAVEAIAAALLADNEISGRRAAHLFAEARRSGGD